MSFTYHNGELHCDGVPLSSIAERVGTPFYVYSLGDIETCYRAYADAFPGALVCYAAKANANLAILQHLARLGAGADVVSGGELYRALKAGVPPDRIVFNGNGKTPEEIAFALESKILCLNLDSREELELVDEMARRRACVAPVAVRVNPDIDPHTHPHIATGLRASKFGVPITEACQLYREAARRPGVRVVGVHCHIGSQITSLGPPIETAKALRDLVSELRADGFDLEHVNLGGGLGIRYRDEAPPTPADWARAVWSIVGDLGCRIILEPGRSIVGSAGALVASVLYLKKTRAKNFLVLDAGMNALIRPALYAAYHTVKPVWDAPAALTADVVGPICESTDVLAETRQLPELRRGDLVAVLDAGAYGFAMANRYNQQPLPAEIVVKEDQFWVVRKRESYAEMTAGEEML